MGLRPSRSADGPSRGSGPTRKETPLSEARSYANLAAANDYFGLVPLAPETSGSAPDHPLSPIPHHPRVMVEERALDSYHNVLFSILQFWRNHDSAVWPQHLTIVSHGFKRARLVESHCSAIAYPLDRVRFVGINPPNLPADLVAADQAGADVLSLAQLDDSSGISEEKAEAMKGAREVIGHWMEDPHGVGEILAGKRKSRNCWGVEQLFFSSHEERERSGVKTRLLGEDIEVLDGEAQPWTIKG